MDKNIDFSIVIPIYNEKKTIKRVLADIKEVCHQFENYEVIIVDDGSTDGSIEEIKDISGIRIIKHPRNKGYGASLKTGIKNAKYGWILIIDSDGTYPVKSIPDLVKKAGKNDLVIGARGSNDSSIQAERRHAKRFLNRFAGYLAGKKIPDLNSGLRIFRKEIVIKYWELFPDKFSFTSTLTMVCLTHGYDTKFVSIEYYKREGKSSIKPTDFFAFLKLVTKLSLFFKPIKVFIPISILLLLGAGLAALSKILGISERFLDTTFIVLCATALQTFFFGLLAEIVIHNRR